MIPSGLPFAIIQRALIESKDPAPGTPLVESVNAEANVIIALLCHADGKRPARTCSRPAIKSILRHVRCCTPGIRDERVGHVYDPNAFLTQDDMVFRVGSSVAELDVTASGCTYSTRQLSKLAEVVNRRFAS